MNVSRESVAQALLTLLQGVNANISYAPAKFQLISRKGAIWSNTPPANQPAMYIIQVAEHSTESASPTFPGMQSIGAQKWIMDFTLQIYALADESGVPVPDTLINAILDGIDKTLQSQPPGERQTLGGLVTNCWIEGTIVIGTGQLDTQLALLVPVRCITGI